MKLVGSAAPEFQLRDQFGRTVALTEFRGAKSLLVLFYPYAFSGVCTGELSEIRDRLDEFVTFDTDVLAISCDPMFSLKAFADRDGLNFALLSDFWPHGAVATSFGVFDAATGSANRSSFVVNQAGLVVWDMHAPRGTARDWDLHLRELRLANEGP